MTMHDAAAATHPAGHEVVHHPGPGDRVLVFGYDTATELAPLNAQVAPDGRVVATKVPSAAVATDLASGDSNFDWIIANGVLPACDRAHLWQELMRLLKPGGWLRTVDVIFECPPDPRRHSAIPTLGIVGPALSEAAYAESLREAGLTEIAIGWRYVFDRTEVATLAGGEFLDVDSLVGWVWTACFLARRPHISKQPIGTRSNQRTGGLP